MTDEYCYGCKHLTGSRDGAGGILYGCKLIGPCVVTGDDAIQILEGLRK